MIMLPHCSERISNPVRYTGIIDMHLLFQVFTYMHVYIYILSQVFTHMHVYILFYVLAYMHVCIPANA